MFKGYASPFYSADIVRRRSIPPEHAPHSYILIYTIRTAKDIIL